MSEEGKMSGCAYAASNFHDNRRSPLIDEIYQKLRTVFDPEIHISIVDLGLIYDVEIDEDNRALVKMSLTTPGCPMGSSIVNQVKREIEKIEEISSACVEVVWSPQWTPEMMNPQARANLGI